MKQFQKFACLVVFSFEIHHELKCHMHEIGLSGVLPEVPMQSTVNHSFKDRSWLVGSRCSVKTQVHGFLVCFGAKDAILI